MLDDRSKVQILLFYIKTNMSDTPSLLSHQPKNVPSLPQKIPITYLWFGKDVPEDYLISLAELNYPVVFLKNPNISRTFTREILDIEKSDYYRLQHLYDYGGIYSDFDNVIKYDCLMQLLEPYRNQDKLVFMTVGNHTRAEMNEMTNNLIFAPYAGMPILKKMLDSVDEKKGRIWGFAGMRFVAQFDQPLQVNMDKCVKHTGDWSWVGASNQVLKRKNKPHDRYASKLTKKREIMAQNDKLELQLNNTKFLKDKINTQLIKLKEENKKLQEQLNATKTQTSKELIKKLKAQDEHKIIEENNEVELSKDDVLMQHQLEYLMEKNQSLQAEKDVMTMMTGGAVVLVLVLVVIAMLLFRRKKIGSFNHLAQTSRNICEEQ